MLPEKTKETIARYGMLKGEEKVLVAVSGGVDSVVLLEVLCILAPELSLALVIAHLDHGLRGREAKEDARFVASLGKAKGVPVILEQIDVARVSKDERLSLEEAGHRVRRRFFEETSQKVGATRIALGHTRNDRAETLLFNLIRGAGPTGLVGIRPVSLPYIRPLIDTSREEVLSFARSQGLAWREDRTNQDLDFSRNRIRHQIIPLLEQMNPRFLDALHRTSDLLLEEQQALETLLERPWEEVRAFDGKGEVIFHRHRLAELPSGLIGLLLRRGITHVRGNLQGIEKVHIDALCRLARSFQSHGELDLPGLAVRVQNDELLLSTQIKAKACPYEFPVRLGKTEFSSLGIAIELSIKERNDSLEDLMEHGRTMEVADADRVHFPLHLRSRRPGDRFLPLGMKNEKKLKDLLSDEHIPFFKRDALPLLCDQERIIWVAGVRLSDAVRVTSKTKRVLVMGMEEST
jgi:tRNA(Ile)-lysidine synthase